MAFFYFRLHKSLKEDVHLVSVFDNNSSGFQDSLLFILKQGHRLGLNLTSLSFLIDVDGFETIILDFHEVPPK